MAVAYADLGVGHHSHHHGGNLGRVKMQVYRGPNQEQIGYGEYFAPWGFYVTLPEDDKKLY